MKITKFDIRNFKGISHATIRLDDGTPGNISTLIGLNESGKTTILEALSHFITEDGATAELVGTVTKKSDLQDLIPKDKKAAFTGKISVSASVELDPADVTDLAAFMLKSKGLVIDQEMVPLKITAERAYEFVDSAHEATHSFWRFPLHVRTKKGRKYRRIEGKTGSTEEDLSIWRFAAAFLRLRLPKIVYFPTFLFDFPDRIYLEDEGTEEINSYYLQVIQDVLDSQGDGLSIQKHIVDRIDKVKNEHKVAATFLAYLFQRDEKKQIDAVLQKASNEMSKTIFGSWNQILGKNATGKWVQIEWLLDGDNSNAPYLEVSIVDGQSTYRLSERSLGFRWFFSFLLFTQFRRNRQTDKGTIFLFDEPAANLHSKAQMKLLDSFLKIAHGSTSIIYSTHSHYMVNPLWLERAYIIENRATDYDNEDDVDAFTIRKTDVKAILYKQFVGANPTKTTYFQPVLDALEVTFSPLVRSSEAIIVEGKNDFYAISYLRQSAPTGVGPELFPGNGSSGSAALISLFRGWGVKFRLLLDDDIAGKQAKKKYMNDYLLSSSEVFTLGDIDPSYSGMELEDLYQDDIRDLAKLKFSVEVPTKHQFALFFQEIVATKKKIDFPKTAVKFNALAGWITKNSP